MQHLEVMSKQNLNLQEKAKMEQEDNDRMRTELHVANTTGTNMESVLNARCEEISALQFDRVRLNENLSDLAERNLGLE